MHAYDCHYLELGNVNFLILVLQIIIFKVARQYLKIWEVYKNRNKYCVRQRALTHSARTPPAVHPGITIWVDEIELEGKFFEFILFLDEIEKK